MSDSKSSKVWRRTIVGGSLAGVLAAVLWAASAFDSAWPVLAVSFGLLGACIVEVDRMGSLRGRRLIFPLAAGALATLAVSLAALTGLDAEQRGDAGYGVLWLGGASALAAASIAALYALAHSTSWIVKLASLAVFTHVAAPQFEWATAISVVATLFVVLRLVVFGAERRAEAAAVLALGVVLVVSLPALTWVWFGMGFKALVALLAIAKLGDTAAYYVGSAWGRHRPFPSISPGKTSEGFAGSLAAGALAGLAAVQFGWLPAAPHGLWGGLLAGAAVNVPAQASDLLESWVKRRAGVKDSGTWFGPSGGVLDLVDSFFLAAPAALLAWPLLLDFDHA